MSTIIQIKRSTGAAAPIDGILENGELAYSQDGSNNGANAILYIESVESGSNVIHRIGGKYYTSIIESATSSSVPNTLVRRDANGAVNLTVSNATTANSWSTPRYIFLGGDLSGNVAIDGSSNVTLTATVINNSVTLGADTTGDYVNNVLAGAGLVASGQGGETANVTLALGTSGVTAGVYGNVSSLPSITVDQYGRITTASNVNLVTTNITEGTNLYYTNARVRSTLTSGNGISYNTTTGNITLSPTGVTANTYGGGATIPVITVDQFGRITTASNSSIATSLSIAGGTGTDTVSLLTDTLTFAGTANEIETAVTNNQVQFGLPDNVTIGNDLTVSGNLVVQGVVTTLNTAVAVVEDPLLKLGNANPADSLDLGFFGVYTSGGTKYAGLFRDASDSGKFKLFQDLQGDPDSVPNVVNTGGAGYAIATLVSHLTGGNVSGLLNPIAVVDGGIGRATLTANSIMFPNTTTSFGFATGTSGQVLQLSTTGIPVFGHLDGGTY